MRLAHWTSSDSRSRRADTVAMTESVSDLDLSGSDLG